MKALLNVHRDFAHDEWIECEGCKLVEQSDGSLDLIVTRDLATARGADQRMADVLARMKKAPEDTSGT